MDPAAFASGIPPRRRYAVSMDDRLSNLPKNARLGAVDDLGLDVRWRHCFIGHGEIARSQLDAVYLDVGGRIEPGVIDHHQQDDGGPPGSTARLVLDRPDLIHDHLMRRWIERPELGDLRGRIWQPLIVVHRVPDVDAFVSASLVKRLVETGGLPYRARELAEFTDEIDQGEFELTRESGATLLGLLAVLQYADGELLRKVDGLSDADLDLRRMRIGIAIVQAWLGRAEEMRGTARARRRLKLHDEQANPALAGLCIDPLARQFGRLLQSFEAEVRSGTAYHKRITARVPTTRPATSRDTIEVPGVVLDQAFFAVSPLALYFARAGICEDVLGRPDLVIEDRGQGMEATHPDARRYVISIRPSIRGNDGLTSRPNLRGLGFKLERLEQVARRRMGKDVERERHGQTRFEEFPGLSDPWYDGRGHAHSIVDSPLHGSLLSFEEIESVVQTAFWEPDLSGISLHLFDHEDRGRTVPIVDAEVDAQGLGMVVEQAKDAGYRVLQMKVHPAWDLESVKEEIQRFVGGRIGEFQMEGLSYVYGRRGLVCIVPQHLDIPGFDGLVKQITPIWAMQEAVNRVHDRLGEGIGQATSPASPSGRARQQKEGTIDSAQVARIIETFVQATSDFRRPTDDGREVRAGVRRHVMAGLDLETQIAATDRLLEHLDDRSERESNARINLVLVLLGLLGLFEVASSLIQHFEADEDWWGIADVFWWVIVIFTVLVVGAGILAAKSPRWSSWIMRWLGIRS